MDTETAEAIARVEKRVTTLERAAVNNTETLKWMAGTLGTVKAVQDEHSQRLDGIDERLDGIDGRLDTLTSEVRGVKTELAALRRDLPGIVAETMREVLKESGS